MISITINVLYESRYTIILYMWPKFQILLSQNGNKHKRSHLRFNRVGNAIIQPFLFVFWSDVAILIANTADIFLPLSTVVTVTFLKGSLLLPKATLSRPGGKRRHLQFCSIFSCDTKNKWSWLRSLLLKFSTSHLRMIGTSRLLGPLWHFLLWYCWRRLGCGLDKKNQNLGNKRCWVWCSFLVKY